MVLLCLGCRVGVLLTHEPGLVVVLLCYIECTYTAVVRPYIIEGTYPLKSIL